MTHHTEAERAEFEIVASDNGKWPKAIERNPKGDYILMATAVGWTWWQAARSAPAVPVPQGWHAPGLGEVHNHDHTKMIYCADGDGVADDGIAQEVLAALAAAPQPPEAAPVQMPEPDAGWFKYDRVSRCWHPQYSEYAEKYAKLQGWQKLYTEQQVLSILAQHGIKTT